jgi:hypothetical protein
MIEKVTPKEFYKKFNFDDSKHLTEDNPILSKQVRKKIDNAKTKSEKILMKANALRQLHKERQRFGDDFLGDNQLNEDILEDLSFDDDELEEDLM